MCDRIELEAENNNMKIYNIFKSIKYVFYSFSLIATIGWCISQFIPELSSFIWFSSALGSLGIALAAGNFALDYKPYTLMCS